MKEFISGLLRILNNLITGFIYSKIKLFSPLFLDINSDCRAHLTCLKESTSAVCFEYSAALNLSCALNSTSTHRHTNTLHLRATQVVYTY